MSRGSFRYFAAIAIERIDTFMQKILGTNRIIINPSSINRFIQYIGKQTQHELNIKWSQYAQWALLTAQCSSLTHKNMQFILLLSQVGNEIDELINGPSRVIRCLVGLAFTSPENSILIEKSFLGDCDRMYNRLEMRKSLLAQQSTRAHFTFSLSIISMDVFSWANFFNSD